jgi:hypothetical protein
MVGGRWEDSNMYLEHSFGNHLKVTYPKRVVHPTSPSQMKLQPPLVEQPLHFKNIESMHNQAQGFYPDHRFVIEDYKEGTPLYSSILRGSGKIYDWYAPDELSEGEEQDRINDLKHVTSHKLVQPQILYRGSRRDSDILPKNSKFTDKGFVSTSYGLETPIEFSFNNRLFAIHAPVGTKAYHIDKLGEGNPAWLHQQEVLLHPDTHFKVVGHSFHEAGNYVPKIHVTHVAVIGQGYNKDKPKYSLLKSPENRAWLKHTKANFDKMVVGHSK